MNRVPIYFLKNLKSIMILLIVFIVYYLPKDFKFFNFLLFRILSLYSFSIDVYLLFSSCFTEFFFKVCCIYLAILLDPGVIIYNTEINC